MLSLNEKLKTQACREGGATGALAPPPPYRPQRSIFLLMNDFKQCLSDIIFLFITAAQQPLGFVSIVFTNIPPNEGIE